MNRQAYSILFCVLFASTFFHEIRAKAAANPEFARVRREVITPKPPVEVDIHLNITVKFSNVITISNEKANVSLLINVVTNTAILINGNTRIAIVIDLKANVVVYIENINVKDFADNPQKGLEAALGSDGGIVLPGTNVTEKVLKAVNDVVINLVANIGVELKVNLKLGLKLIINISKELIVILKGDLNGLLKHIGAVVIRTKKDLAGLYNFLLGLGKCIGSVQGGIAAVTATLNLQVLLNLGNGLEVLLALLGQLGAQSKSLTFLNDLELYILVVALLGGLQNDGLNGTCKVLAAIVRFIKGNASLEIVITALIEVLAWRGHSKPFPGITKNTLKTLNSLLILLKGLGLTKVLGGLVSFIDATLKGTFVFGGVNLSAILTLLLQVFEGTTSSLLEILVRVLFLLKSVVSNEVALVRCLLTLLFHLTSTIGRQLLRTLGFVVYSVLGLISYILANLSKFVGKILELLLGNLFEALLKIPIIGDVVKLLAAVIKSVTSGKIDLKAVLNNPTLKVYILGFIQLESGLPLKITANIRLQVEILLKSCTSISTYIGFYPDILGPRQCSEEIIF